MRELVISVLSSSIVAAVITFLLNKMREKKRYKKLLLDDVMGYRYQISENYYKYADEFIHALNRIFIVYNDNSKVIEALKRYKEDCKIDNLAYLIRVMGEDVGIKQVNIVDSFYLEPFTDNRQKNLK